SLDRALARDRTGKQAPRAPRFIRIGSCIGGDRDGNPTVTAAVATQTMEIQSQHILLALEAGATRIGRTLTVDVGTTPPSSALRRRLSAARRADPTQIDAVVARSPHEPHRLFLLHIASRVAATRLRERALAYRDADDLVGDLRVLRESLAEAGASRLAFGEVQHLIWQAETFGFHLAEL